VVNFFQCLNDLGIRVRTADAIILLALLMNRDTVISVLYIPVA